MRIKKGISKFLLRFIEDHRGKKNNIEEDRGGLREIIDPVTMISLSEVKAKQDLLKSREANQLTNQQCKIKDNLLAQQWEL